MREADHRRASGVGPGSRDSADEAAGQGDIRGWDAKADSVGKVGLDRNRLVAIAVEETYSNGQESRRRSG